MLKILPKEALISAYWIKVSCWFKQSLFTSAICDIFVFFLGVSLLGTIPGRGISFLKARNTEGMLISEACKGQSYLKIPGQGFSSSFFSPIFLHLLHWFLATSLSHSLPLLLHIPKKKGKKANACPYDTSNYFIYFKWIWSNIFKITITMWRRNLVICYCI